MTPTEAWGQSEHAMDLGLVSSQSPAPLHILPAPQSLSQLCTASFILSADKSDTLAGTRQDGSQCLGTHVHLRSTRIRTYTALYIFLRCLKPLNSLSFNQGPPHCCLGIDIKHENVSFAFKKMREDTDLPQMSTTMFLRNEMELFIFFFGFLYCFYLHLISIYCASLVLKFWQSDIVSELKYLTPAKKQN